MEISNYEKHQIYKVAKAIYLDSVQFVESQSGLPFEDSLYHPNQNFSLLIGQDSMPPGLLSVYLCDCCRFAGVRLGIAPGVVFSELLELKPKGASFNWWPINDRKSRIEAIDKCIEATKPTTL